MSLVSKNAVYWYLFWWRDSSNFYEYFNDRVREAQLTGNDYDLELYCKVIAIRQWEQKYNKEVKR